MPPSLPALRAATLLAAFAVLPAAAAQGLDADVLAAKAAFQKGDRARLDAIAPRTRGHPLEPYVAWWQLKLRIDTADAAELRAFTARYASTPLAERARDDWLRAVGKRSDWAVYASTPGATEPEDADLRCYAAQAARARDGDAALAAAKPLWFTGKATPDACDPVFTALMATGAISVADRWARYRLALEAGGFRLAQQVAGGLPASDRLGAGEFQRIDARPVDELARGNFRWKARDGRELALYALERAARADPEDARSGWIRWRERLPAQDRAWGDARLAYHASRALLPWANAAWREPLPAEMSAEMHAWRARAALRAQSWRDLAAAIDAMPASMAEEAGWRYWRARSLEASGRDGEADVIYRALSVGQDYYALLAADAQGVCVSPMSETVAVDAAWQAKFGARPDVVRAVKLAELDLRADSQREWYAIVRDMDDDALNQASLFAAGKRLNDRSINTANRTRERHDYALRYPTPWRDQFATAARDNGIEEAMLFGIARQESRFTPEIVSSAGAIGLMQLMPATAKWVAKQSGRADYRPSRINDVDVNTQFGAFYFRYWLDRLDGSWALAAAAYNAGPGRAQAWRPAAELDGAAWVETIPFNETRDYVKKVLANSVVYARALGDPAIDVTRRLGRIGPRAPETAALVAKD